MKSAKLVFGLLLGLTLLASPAFAQRDVQGLISKASQERSESKEN